MPNCNKCEAAPNLLPTGLYNQAYCPTCKSIYRKSFGTKENSGYTLTESVYVPPAPPFVLQPSNLPRNDAFAIEVRNVTVYPRPDQHDALSLGSEAGFSYAQPLLHFIWFGTPPSASTFAPVMKWATTLSKAWGGVCLWLDNVCIQTLVPQIAGVTSCKEELVSPLKAALKCRQMIVKSDHLPIYILSIDDHLSMLATNETMLALAKAIDFERAHSAPYQLVQVASDIMRVIVLRYYGGCYMDFDVDPHLRCGRQQFPEPGLIPLGRQGILCHAKPITGFGENDIIFADPTNERTASLLNGVLRAMAFEYKEPKARAVALEKSILLTLKDKAIVTLEKYALAFKISGMSLYNLAYLVEQDSHRGQKLEYAKALDGDVALVCRLISESVDKVTFSPFKACIPEDNKLRWAKLQACFSHETLSKPFYSWGDPGASASLKVIDSTITLQAAIRGYLASKELAERQRVAQGALEVALGHLLTLLADLPVSEQRRGELAHSWLADIVRDYGHMPSVLEIDGWIRMNWPD